MKSLLTKSLLALASLFLICSCADSKDKVVDDMADLIEETAQAAMSGDQARMTKLQEDAKDIQKRAEALGINLSNPSTLTKEQAKKLQEAGTKALSESFKKMNIK